MNVQFLSRISYHRAVEIQAEALAARVDGLIADTVFLLEHDPVVTVGRAFDARLTDPQRLALRDRGVEIVNSDRGGQATFHGPGQLVVYPVLNLRDRDNDAHAYLRSLERLIIEWLASYGVTARVQPGLTGVWADGGKIASIGVSVRRGITCHGFAVNLDTDLSVFQLFDPCGQDGSRITSMYRETGDAPSLVEAATSITRYIEKFLDKSDSARDSIRVPAHV